VLDAVAERIDISRVGVKAGPAWAERGRFRSTADTLATSEYVVERLNTYPLAHWLLMGARRWPTSTVDPWPRLT
jgi:N-ethylmaleimide reductase